jgi:hypothetical protein
VWAILGPNSLKGILKDLSAEIRQREVHMAAAQVDPDYLAETGVDPDLPTALADDQEPLLHQWTELCQHRLGLYARFPGELGNRSRPTVCDFLENPLLSAFWFDH